MDWTCLASAAKSPGGWLFHVPMDQALIHVFFKTREVAMQRGLFQQQLGKFWKQMARWNERPLPLSAWGRWPRWKQLMFQSPSSAPYNYTEPSIKWPVLPSLLTCFSHAKGCLSFISVCPLPLFSDCSLISRYIPGKGMAEVAHLCSRRWRLRRALLEGWALQWNSGEKKKCLSARPPALASVVLPNGVNPDAGGVVRRHRLQGAVMQGGHHLTPGAIKSCYSSGEWSEKRGRGHRDIKERIPFAWEMYSGTVRNRRKKKLHNRWEDTAAIITNSKTENREFREAREKENKQALVNMEITENNEALLRYARSYCNGKISNKISVHS